MNLVELVRREIARALNGTRGALRGVLTSINRATQVQLVDLEGLSAEQLKAVELFQHFGFTSAPPAGTQLIVLPLGGRTSAAVLVASEHGTHRFTLDADGEACLYNQWGDCVHMRADRTIHLQAQAKVLIDTDEVEINAATSVTINTADMTVNASGSVALNTPTVAASDDVTVGATLVVAESIEAGTSVDAGTNITAVGEISDSGGAKTMSGMRGVFNDHTHPENNTPTNVTSTTGTPM